MHVVVHGDKGEKSFTFACVLNDNGNYEIQAPVNDELNQILLESARFDVVVESGVGYRSTKFSMNGAKAALNRLQALIDEYLKAQK